MKKIILVFILMFSLITFGQKGPEFEVYTGMIVPKPQYSNLGYMIGLNVTPDLFQIEKNNNKKNREYLNKILLGIEFSGYQTKEFTEIHTTNQTTPQPITNCNCTNNPIDVISQGGKYVTKQDILGVSLNIGVEIYDGWFLLSGISSYQHRNIINNETLNKYRTTYIDGGIKKYIKIGRSYWSPTFKFNSEVITFGLGYSFYK